MSKSPPDLSRVQAFYQGEPSRILTNIAFGAGCVAAFIAAVSAFEDGISRIVVIGFAAALIAFGLYNRQQAKKRAFLYADLERNGRPHTARVTAIEKSISQMRGRRTTADQLEYILRYSFRGPNGELLNGAMSKKALVFLQGISVGDDIAILVDPDDPARHVPQFWVDIINEPHD